MNPVLQKTRKKLYLFYMCNIGFSFTHGNENTFFAEGEIVRVEVILLSLFKICKYDSSEEKTCMIVERTELDFFIKRGIFLKISKKECIAL